MAIYFSPSKVAFYNTDIVREDQIPTDKVTVTESEYAALMIAQNNGEIIVAGEGGKPASITQTCGSCDCLVVEKNLQAQIDAEATERKRKDNELQGLIALEETNRKDADTDLKNKIETVKGNIDNEAIERSKSDLALQVNINELKTYVNDKFVVVDALPSSPTEGVFYFVMGD